MRNSSEIILGAAILAAAAIHAFWVARPGVHDRESTSTATRNAPLYVGHVAGEIWQQEQNGVAKLKCDGFKVELFEPFVLVYVDKAKEPTWTDDFVLTIPWNKVEHLTLRPQ